MADLNMVLKESQKLNGNIRSLLRLFTYDDYDDLSGLHIDYEDADVHSYGLPDSSLFRHAPHLSTPNRAL